MFALSIGNHNFSESSDSRLPILFTILPEAGTGQLVTMAFSSQSYTHFRHS